MTAVAAVYDDFGLGDGITQPVVLKADRRRFRALTDGRTIVVGRTTFEDMPALTGRQVLVLTHRDLPNAVHRVEDIPEDAIICGGASVFLQLFPKIDHIYLTQIHARPASTRFFPPLDGWRIETNVIGSEDGIVYEFQEAWRE